MASVHSILVKIWAKYRGHYLRTVMRSSVELAAARVKGVFKLYMKRAFA